MIMMCLIMDAHPSEDVSVHIQHTLIEAYCFEQDIHLLKVQLSTPYSSTLTIKYIDFKVILPTMSICWNEGWQFC